MYQRRRGNKMKKKVIVSLMDLMVLSISAVFFISLMMTGELLIMFVMGVVVMGSLNAYWYSRKKYLCGNCC